MFVLPSIPVKGDFAMTCVLAVAEAQVAVRIPPLIKRGFLGPSESQPFLVWL
jgi:hypothetical protein